MTNPTPPQIQSYVAGRLKFVTDPDSEGWRKVHCPMPDAHSHGDQNASATFNMLSGYLKCHGCGLEGLIGKIHSELGWPAPPWNRYKTSTGKRPLSDWEGRPITRWEDYTDENGTVLYSKARVDTVDAKGEPSKEFLFWAKGSWNLKGKNIRRVPYHLPNLANAEEILIVEGESDVRAAEELGLVATTIDNGAKGNPCLLVDFIKPKQRVVVLVDQDKPGERYREKVLDALNDRVASLKSVRLPDLESGKKDLRDWVGARRDDLVGAAEQLCVVIEATEEWQSPQVTTEPETSCGQQKDKALTVEDFYAYMPQHLYIFVDTRELWPKASVNARVEAMDSEGAPIKASAWLDNNRSVEQMTWAPNQPMLISGRLISEGGWIEKPGRNCFNLYRPPLISSGDPAEAKRWLKHLEYVYGPDAEHIKTWLAHRIQKPHEKINHALVLGGAQGIGKDTILEPVKFGVGHWNFIEISPTHLVGRFNGFVKSVILRINEAHDLGDGDRYSFYEHLKIYTAAPPDVLRCDEKNLREHSILNVCGVIITTNHKTDGIFLPADDRRHFVAWSERKASDFSENYWADLYKWYENGGYANVVAYLRGLDISSFNPKAPPPKTDAFWAIVDANRAPEEAELIDIIEARGNPNAITLESIASNNHCSSGFAEWLRDRRNSRQIPHRMESAGYVPVRNPTVKDGLWTPNGKRQVIYARQELSPCNRIAAASELTQRDGQRYQ